MLLEKQGNYHGTYRYKAFGLHITSDVLLPEFLPAADASVEPDVMVRWGKVPTDIPGSTVINHYVVARNKVLVRIPGWESFYVSNGNCIVVEPDKEAAQRSIRLSFPGVAFGLLLLQRGIVPLHGSAVVFDGYCAVFAGRCGVGKSTLAAAFRKRGYPILTDDVAAITVDGGGVPCVQPAYPQQKLSQDSGEAIGLDITSGSSGPPGGIKGKFDVPIYEEFYPSPVPLGAVYELSVQRSRDIRITRLSSNDRWIVLMGNIYLCWLVDRLGLEGEYFKRCLDLARGITVSSLIRPEGVFSLEEQVRLVQEDLHELGMSHKLTRGNCRDEIKKGDPA